MRSLTGESSSSTCSVTALMGAAATQHPLAEKICPVQPTERPEFGLTVLPTDVEPGTGSAGETGTSCGGWGTIIGCVGVLNCGVVGVAQIPPFAGSAPHAGCCAWPAAGRLSNIAIVIARNGMLGIIYSSSGMRRTLGSNNRLPGLGVPARRHAPSLNCGHARFQSAAVFVDQPRRAAKSLSR
jgi:hypothetical protein